MSKQTHTDVPPAPVPSTPADIRNVVLVGPSGSGKSGLLAQLTDTISRAGAGKGADAARSVGVSVAAIESEGHVVNVVDTPGHPDFVGEVRAGIRAADAAVFVISAVDEIDGATALLWQECAGLEVPRAIVVTKLDLPRADLDNTVAACRRAFGDTQPVWRPDGEGGLTDLLATREDSLVEAIIEASEDETLLDRYLGGEELAASELSADLHTAVGRARFFPVVPVDFLTGSGVPELLGLIRDAFPSPLEARLPRAFTPAGAPLSGITCDPDQPLVAEVIRTTTDPYVGRMSLVRVFSGTLRSDSAVHVSGHLTSFTGGLGEGHQDHDDDERLGPLASPYGEATRPKAEAIAGDIAVVTKLSRAETSDTLSAPERPAVVEPWVLPSPLLPVAIRATSASDEDKLAAALARVVAEDVTMRLEHSSVGGEHQIVLWTMGQAHVDDLLARLSERYGITVETDPLRLSLRETFLRACTVQGRHVKQSGGHGQYAVCDLTIEPLERGSGIEFVDKVVGGAVPRQFIPSVEKGVRAQLDKGVIAGYPVVDVRVTLTDGKAHSVDSSDMAFQTAAALAMRQAANEQTVALLEPVDAVAISVADEHVGAIMSDLRSRRAHVHGTEPDELEGWTVVRAEIPQTELSRYPIDLRSLSHGTGRFSREQLRYDYLPTALAKEHLR